MDAQRWDSLVRYAYSFGSRKAWYNFYKIEADHDRFANINYRTIPSVGFGYWFWDKDEYKAMVETGIGWEHVDYRQSLKAKDEPVLLPRAYFEKKFFGSCRISQEISYYPSLKQDFDYRVRAETAFASILTKAISLVMRFIDDYNSNPGEGIKKNDTRFITALKYSF